MTLLARSGVEWAWITIKNAGWMGIIVLIFAVTIAASFAVPRRPRRA